MADPVNFTRPAAQRIARVVRAIEDGERGQTPFEVARPWDAPASQKVFRICTYTGSWTKDTFKTVTFYNQTATPNTVAAMNLFAALNADCNGSACAIARDGTAWYLISAEC